MTRHTLVSRRDFGRVAAGGLAAGVLIVAGPRLALTEPKVGGTLKLAFDHDAGGFDPAKAVYGMSHAVIEQVYSGLTALDSEANPYPDLAETIDISEDGKVYTFHLRTGVTFHDGSPFSADDVKFTIDRLKNPATGYSYASQLANVTETTVVDPNTVQITLSEATGPFLVNLAFPGSMIVSKKLVESGHDINATPIGTGPYTFGSYQPGTVIKLARNPKYHESPKPYIEHLEYTIISDQTAITTALQSGVVNFSNVIPAKDWAAIEANPDLTKAAIEGGRWFWIMVNNQKPPLDNAKVRQAIAHAIDRQAIVDAVFYGLAKVIQGGVVPEWSWGHAPELKVLSPKADPEKAKALLAEAGFPNGLDLDFKIGTEWPALMAMGPIIQANLQAAGMNAKISTMGTTQYLDEVWAKRGYDISDMYWLSPLADPDDFTSLNYLCGSPMNAQGSCSKEMDALLNEARSAPTKEARADAYRRMQALSMEEMTLVPLVSALILHAHTNKLQGFKPMRTGFLKTLKEAWLEG
ncbi:MAG: ABC transporter substrate-binding protein [Alphaproteobacteria bacterium]|nr:ABC transporter substrate-binding protein [Alphaproteobacteria bacterium]